MSEHQSFLKQPKAKRSKGRARPDEPLAPWCEIAVPGVCTGHAQHRHHIVLRSQGGTDALTADCCFKCHEHVHANPAWAKAHGWIKSRWTA